MSKRKNEEDVIVLSDSDAENNNTYTGDKTTYDSLSFEILHFDPYTHVDVTSWTATSTGRCVPYSFLTAACIHLSKTRSRIAITTVLTNTLRTIIAYEPAALCDTIYLLTNHIGPTYEKKSPPSSSPAGNSSNSNSSTNNSSTTKDQLGIGSQILSKVLKESCGLSPKELKLLWNKHGDMGDVAFHAKNSIRTLQLVTPPPLLITKVYSTLVQISSVKGPKTSLIKVNLIKSLMLSAKGEEIRYLVRTLVSNLRIGAVRLTVLSSLARAFCLVNAIKDSNMDSTGERNDFTISKSERLQYLQSLSSTSTSNNPSSLSQTSPSKRKKTNNNSKSSPPSPLLPPLQKKLQNAESLIRQIFVQHPNYNHITEALLKHGLHSKDTLLNQVGLTVGIPLCPMLGQITRDVSDIVTLNRLPPNSSFTAEWKYDGQRVQIHAIQLEHGDDNVPSHLLGGGKVMSSNQDKDKKIYIRLFSRHLEDMTEKYPDVLNLVPLLMERKLSSSNITSFIMDAEICAIDPSTGALQTFQTLSNRAKKDVQIKDVSVNVGIFAFDLMYFNGQSILKESFRKRRDILRSYFPPLISSPPSSTLTTAIAQFNHVHSFDGKIPSSPDLFHNQNGNKREGEKEGEIEQEENIIDTLRAFMNDAISSHCEGLMVKLLDNNINNNIHNDNSYDDQIMGSDDEVDDDIQQVNFKDESDIEEEENEKGGFNDDDDEIKIIQQSKKRNLIPSSSPKKEKKENQQTQKKIKNSSSRLLSTYEPDKRVDSWLKCKRDYGALGDSIDLVPIGAWHGMGRKAGWWSPILLALYDPETGHFQAVCKCISGFTDAFYISLNKRYPKDSDTCSSRNRLASVDTGGVYPDVWWLPSEVWEIRGADITLSPVYPASQGLAHERGLSLRFPRFYRVRDDKSIEQATTSHEFAAAYRKQAGI